MVSRFVTVHECDRQTVGRTDGQQRKPMHAFRWRRAVKTAK